MKFLLNWFSSIGSSDNPKATELHLSNIYIPELEAPTVNDSSSIPITYDARKKKKMHKCTSVGNNSPSLTMVSLASSHRYRHVSSF